MRKDGEGFIDVESIKLTDDLKPKPEYWKLPAALAVLLIALTATLGTFGMMARLDEYNAETRCRSELITTHELARAEFDELVIAQFLARESGNSAEMDIVEERVNLLAPRLQHAREARANAGVTCAAKG